MTKVFYPSPEELTFGWLQLESTILKSPLKPGKFFFKRLREYDDVIQIDLTERQISELGFHQTLEGSRRIG